MAGYCSGVMSGSRCTRTSGSPDLRRRSKITASDSLASTNTPRTALPPCCFDLISGRDAGERQHRMHQHVGAGGAIGLRGVFELIVADAVLAGHEHHRGRHHRVEIAGVMAGAGRDTTVRIAELLGGVLDRVDEFWIEMRRRLAPDQVELHLDLAPR